MQSSLLSRDPATSLLYTLSLHDALPISFCFEPLACNDSASACVRPTIGALDAFDTLLPGGWCATSSAARGVERTNGDRKSTRLNSSHVSISYAVFCLKKKKMLYTNPLPL